MKIYTKNQIEEKVKELWQKDFFYDDEMTMTRIEPPEIKIEINSNKVSITIQRMYEAPGLSFAQLKSLSEFFETDNINDDDRFGHGGCETCDYGSCYGFTLEIS